MKFKLSEARMSCLRATGSFVETELLHVTSISKLALQFSIFAVRHRFDQWCTCSVKIIIISEGKNTISDDCRNLDIIPLHLSVAPNFYLLINIRA